MNSSSELDDAGLFDARYLAFLETSRQLRPSLHRYCARMTGSVLDGEDVVQESLFQAYRKLDSFDDERPMTPWLFQIAHNRCIDFLRRREVREGAEAAVENEDVVMPSDPKGVALDRAVERLVLTLPPMERACVLLKDVLDHSLEETAAIVGSTVGGVKAALNRGRGKLAPTTQPPAAARIASANAMRLLGLYVERFNRRDWDGLRELIAADARLLVADRYAGAMNGSPYFGRYAEYAQPWRMVLGALDGELVGIGLQPEGVTWVRKWIVRIDVDGDRITRVADYTHTPWLLRAASSVVVDDSQVS
jgi:RNA polymerase sigma-70 factor, ECF subfamily